MSFPQLRNKYLPQIISSVAAVLALTLEVSDDLNNWSDQVSLNLSYNLTLSDNSNNIADSADLNLSYEKALSDDANNLVESVALNLEYRKQLSDDLNTPWQENVVANLGYLKDFSDDLNNWNDAFSVVLGFVKTLSDDLNGWADAVQLNLSYEVPLSDSLNLSDSIAIGYGLSIPDSIAWSDSLGIGYGLVIADSLNNWNDSAELRLNIALEVSDNLNAPWQDAIAIINGYHVALSDALVFSDDCSLGYGQGITDNFVLSDSTELVLGYLVSFSDNLNNWNDLVSLRVDVALEVSDNLNNPWQDLVELQYNYLIGVSDSLASSDQLSLGHGGSLSDSFTLSDSIAIILGLNKELSDDLNSWNDTTNLRLDLALALSDNFVISDFCSLGYGNNHSDSLTLTDATNLVLGYEKTLEDSLNSWLDNFEANMAYLLSLSDNSNSYNDQTNLNVSYELGFSDTNSLTDYSSLGYGNSLVDSLNNWQEFVDILRQDATGSERQVISSDTLNNWNDINTQFIYGYILRIFEDINANSWDDRVELSLQVFTRTMCIPNFSVFPSMSANILNSTPVMSTNLNVLSGLGGSNLTIKQGINANLDSGACQDD